MIDLAHVTTGLFGLCTRLFPQEFRREYGEELKEVFGRRLRDVLQKEGLPGLVKFCWHEFRDLPVNIFKEHLSNLRKMFGRDQSPAPVSAKRTALAGAWGFALGQALLVLITWVSDPANDLAFKHFGLGLLRETILYGMVGGIGWWWISRKLFPARVTSRLVWRGIGFGALGGLLSTFLYMGSYKFPDAYANLYLNQLPIHFLESLIALIVPAAFGAPIACEREFRKRGIILIAAAILSFWIGSLVSGRFYALIFERDGFPSLPYVWLVHYWGLPLAASAAVNGLVGGALWGWLLGRIKPRQPGREAPGESTAPSSSHPGSQRFLAQPMRLAE